MLVFSTREFNMFVDLDLLLTERWRSVFFLCHWAVSCNKLAKRHVSRAQPPMLLRL